MRLIFFSPSIEKVTAALRPWDLQCLKEANHWGRPMCLPRAARLCRTWNHASSCDRSKESHRLGFPGCRVRKTPFFGPGFSLLASFRDSQHDAGLFGKSNATMKQVCWHAPARALPGAGTCHVYTNVCFTKWHLEKDDTCSQQPFLTCFPVYVARAIRIHSHDVQSLKVEAQPLTAQAQVL